MSFVDMREWITRLDTEGELRRIKAEVDWDRELGAIAPGKEVIIRGTDIDQTEFPVPKWHYLEGGRYIHTFSGIVTRDPETRAMNVGIYRGMIGKRNTAPFLLIKGGQHWGQHFLKY